MIITISPPNRIIAGKPSAASEVIWNEWWEERGARKEAWKKLAGNFSTNSYVQNQLLSYPSLKSTQSARRGLQYIASRQYI